MLIFELFKDDFMQCQTRHYALSATNRTYTDLEDYRKILQNFGMSDDEMDISYITSNGEIDYALVEKQRRMDVNACQGK